jgi:hypothetical protein
MPLLLSLPWLKCAMLLVVAVVHISNDNDVLLVLPPPLPPATLQVL